MKSQPKISNRRLFLEAGQPHFERRAVLNPCVHEEGGEYHMLYRAVDPDMVSTVGYLKFGYEDGEPVVLERAAEPLLAPREDFERHGAEDPRLVRFEGDYHLFYTGWDGYNARLVHASGPTLDSIDNRHVAGPNYSNEEALRLLPSSAKLDVYRERWAEDPPEQKLWEKDATILPRRIDGKIVFIHRLRPDMQIAWLDSIDQLGDPDFWESYLREMDQHLMMDRSFWWEQSHMGMGPVPIETPEGWLMIHHGVNRVDGVQTYRAGAALLDLNDPQRVIGRTPEPLFEPEQEWEKVGDVNNVVFPEGLVQRGDELDIFYGGADSVIGVVTVRMDELIDFLKQQGNG